MSATRTHNNSSMFVCVAKMRLLGWNRLLFYVVFCIVWLRFCDVTTIVITDYLIVLKNIVTRHYRTSVQIVKNSTLCRIDCCCRRAKYQVANTLCSQNNHSNVKKMREKIYTHTSIVIFTVYQTCCFAWSAWLPCEICLFICWEFVYCNMIMN